MTIKRTVDYEPVIIQPRHMPDEQGVSPRVLLVATCVDHMIGRTPVSLSLDEARAVRDRLDEVITMLEDIYEVPSVG